jgi:uncharacterized protein (DUF433 family)
MKQLPDRITINQQILDGKSVIRGLRISVEHILNALAVGIPQEELLEDYPDLEPEDFQAVLMYAAKLVEETRIYSIAT